MRFSTRRIILAVTLAAAVSAVFLMLRAPPEISSTPGLREVAVTTTPPPVVTSPGPSASKTKATPPPQEVLAATKVIRATKVISTTPAFVPQSSTLNAPEAPESEGVADPAAEQLAEAREAAAELMRFVIRANEEQFVFNGDQFKIV